MQMSESIVDQRYSTGGIIALALGVLQWPVEKCIKEFKQICDQAFIGREFHGIDVLEQLATLQHGSKYKTRSFHQSLRESLGEDPLFGGRKHRNSDHAIKVAVTSTSATGKQPYVLANYSRSDYGNDFKQPYTFIRRDDPGLELQVCQAAAATSAAPGYFKEFYHEPTHLGFLDGALYHNCPVQIAHREARLIWPDIADVQPDLFLSIGTGVDDKALEQELAGGQARINIESL